jgi:hypothetical protein
MTRGDGARVTCPACGRTESFDTLAAARTHIEAHRAETGHDPTWELGRLAAGVERAGATATVCGDDCAVDSPLVAADGDESPDPSDSTGAGSD